MLSSIRTRLKGTTNLRVEGKRGIKIGGMIKKIDGRLGTLGHGAGEKYIIAFKHHFLLRPLITRKTA